MYTIYYGSFDSNIIISSCVSTNQHHVHQVPHQILYVFKSEFAGSMETKKVSLHFSCISCWQMPFLFFFIHLIVIFGFGCGVTISTVEGVRRDSSFLTLVLINFIFPFRNRIAVATKNKNKKIALKSKIYHFVI